MILIESKPESQPSLFSQAIRYILKILRSPQTKTQTVIDLRGPNQAVDEYRRGLAPLFLHKKQTININLMRKKLLKKRYLQILCEEGNQEFLISKKMDKIVKTVKIGKIEDIEQMNEGIRKVNAMIVNSQKSKIFDQDFLQLKQGQKVLSDTNKIEQNTNKKSQIFAKIIKDISVSEKKQERQVKSNLIPEATADKKDSTQNNANPFLASTTKKLSFSALISSNIGEPTSKKPLQQNQFTIFQQGQQLKQQQKQAIASKNNILHEEPYQNETPVFGQHNQYYNAFDAVPVNSLNMFNNNQAHSLKPQTLATNYTLSQNYKSSVVAIFMPSSQNSQSFLFQTNPRKTKTSKQRGKKKKGPERVYQQ